jgi:hypothetical protein
MRQENTPASELEALFVDSSEQAVDSLLRGALETLVGVTRDGKIVRKAPFLKLADTAKILTYLLARQALVRLQVPSAKLSATADQLSTECGVPLKSTREHLSLLKAKRLLDKDQEGYLVPTWAISNVVETIRKND